jgi:hypothetical protein
MFSIRGFKKVAAHYGVKPYIKHTGMTIPGGAWYIMGLPNHDSVECKVAMKNYQGYFGS